MKKTVGITAILGILIMGGALSGPAWGQTPEIVSSISITTSRYTGGIEYYNGYLYESGDQNDNKVHIRTKDGTLVEIWYVPVHVKAIMGICYDSKRDLFWYKNAAQRTVYGVRPGGSTVEQTLSLVGDDGFSIGIWYDEAEDQLLFANPETGQLHFYDPNTLSFIKEINLGFSAPGICRAGNYYWLTKSTGDGGNAFLVQCTLEGVETGVSLDLPDGSNDYDVGDLCVDDEGFLWIRGGQGTAIYKVDIGYTPSNSSHVHDYDGDGDSDIGIFRPSTGLWAVQGITRLFLGTSGDIPLPGDFSGDGTLRPAIFRPATGYWKTSLGDEAYFGKNGDRPAPADYNGDGTEDIAIFRNGLWAIKDQTRFFFGASGDMPVYSDFDLDGTRDIGIFRPSAGLWAIRGVTRAFFGLSGDLPVPGKYLSGAAEQLAVYRPSTGLWAIRGYTSLLFGAEDFRPQQGDYDGDGITDIAGFWRNSGYFVIHQGEGCLFGAPGDIPIAAHRYYMPSD